MVWVVQGISAIVPGVPLTLHATEEGAHLEAAKLVNIIRREGAMRPTATPSNWRSKLGAVQTKMDWEERADVWIVECEVRP